ncbi:unnamed protein product, partial [marine sediment metagenome]
TISFTLSDNAYVTLKVFDESSVLVKTLLDGELLAVGGNSITWDGTDGSSALVSDGLYSYTIDAVDDLGNAAVQQVGDVLLDTRKPLDLISPEDGATLAGTVTLVATQVDDYTIRSDNYAPYFTAIGTGCSRGIGRAAQQVDGTWTGINKYISTFAVSRSRG